MWEEEAADLEDELGGGVLAAAGLEQLGRVRAAKREKQRRQQVGYPAGKQAEAAEQPLVAVHLVVRLAVLLHRHVGQEHLRVVQVAHLVAAHLNCKTHVPFGY